MIRLRNQKGVTLVETVITLLIVGLVVLAWINAMRHITRGSVHSKSRLRAQNLALSKLEEAKAAVNMAAQAGDWENVTRNAMAAADAIPKVANLENRSFTWRVTYAFVNVTLNGAPVLVANPFTMTSTTVALSSEVFWSDLDLKAASPFSLTITGYVTNTRE